MRHIGTLLLGATLVTGCGKQTPPPANSTTQSSTNDVPKKNADAGRDLRQMALTAPAAKIGIQRTDDFPRTYGALIDWPIGDGNIATIVGLSDGSASLYTSSTFGIIGGVSHESVRKAAVKFVKTADGFYNDSVPTSDFSYPAKNRIKFYLITFDGVRVIEADYDSIYSGKDKFSELFGDGQNLLTELRLITERKSQ
jgi:hypothetical protein